MVFMDGVSDDFSTVPSQGVCVRACACVCVCVCVLSLCCSVWMSQWKRSSTAREHAVSHQVIFVTVSKTECISSLWLLIGCGSFVSLYQ
jgi:hypothetical protein